MSVANLGVSPILISIITSLVVGGAVFIYFRKRIGELETLHMQQAQILRSFISRSQSQPQAFVAQPQSVNSANLAMAGPPSNQLDAPKITISDGEAQSSEDSGEEISESEYETSSVSGDSVAAYSSDGDDNVRIVPIENETRTVELEGNAAMKVESELITSNDVSRTQLPPEIKMVELGPIGVDDSSSVADDESDKGSDTSDEEVAESSNSSSTEEPANYRQMKVDELRAIAITKGIVTSIDDAKKIKKSELVTLLSAGTTIAID